MDIIALKAAKNYVDKSLNGLGALKGKPCTIDKIEHLNNKIIITFKWYSINRNNEEIVEYNTLELNRSMCLWVASTKYYIDDVAIYENCIYRCIKDNNDSVFNIENWNKMGSLQDITRKTLNTVTANIDAGTLYDLGKVKADDEIDITINIPKIKTGTEIYHCKFVAGSTEQSISISASDNKDIEIKGTTDFEVGTTYEISIWDYVAIIG